MRPIIAAIIIALATVPGLIVLATATSHAQFKGGRGGGSKEDPGAAAKKKPDDSQYKAAIERLPDKKFDPWQNMR